MKKSNKNFNILWIGVDQMRADSLSNHVCQTPFLDRLVEESANFRRAYSPSSLCSPARASMYTGLFAFNHGMGTNCDMYHSLARELPDPEQLLHKRLLKLGYRCGFAGKWHVGTELSPGDYGYEGMNIPGYGDLRRYAAYLNYLEENDLSYGPVKNPNYSNYNQQTLNSGEWNGPLESTPTYFLANFAIDLLADFAAAWKKEKKPFFLNCQFWAPHGPYLPSPEFLGRHDRSMIPPWGNFPDNYEGKPRSLNRFVNSFFRNLPSTWEGWQEQIGLGYDFTTMLDAQIGRLLQKLDELGLSESTAVVFTSDHGDMMGSHGLQDKGFMYEEAHRIPLLIRLPGQKNGFSCEELVYNMDIMPTLFDLIGEELESHLDSQSLLPYLKGQEHPVREAIYLEFHGIRYLQTQRGLVTKDGMKYIFNPGDDDELYDLNEDPSEMHNLIAGDLEHPRLGELQNLLIQMARTHNDPIQDCIAKWFGQWQNYSGQPDVSSQYLVETQPP
jgi:arylsulfatase A-like enzyme